MVINMEHLNENVKQLFRYINEDKLKAIDEYCLMNITNDYKNLTEEEITQISNIYSTNDEESIREYSGYNYKHINNALRGTWNYEENGSINDKNKFQERGRNLSEIITSNPTYLGNFKAYRGVNISYFKEYEIENIEDLEKLKGQFLLDKGFVSTSIQEDRCYFKKENDLGIDYNVKITYLIPEDFNDGIFLQGNMTYSESQKEYLINSYNLAKVTSVTINDDNTAHITAIMIPKMIYDDYYASLAASKTK